MAVPAHSQEILFSVACFSVGVPLAPLAAMVDVLDVSRAARGNACLALPTSSCDDLWPYSTELGLECQEAWALVFARSGTLEGRVAFERSALHY